MPIEINGNLYFTQNWYGETSQKFTHSFNCEKVNISDTIIKSNKLLSIYNLHISLIQSVYLFSMKIYMVY